MSYLKGKKNIFCLLNFLKIKKNQIFAFLFFLGMKMKIQKV